MVFYAIMVPVGMTMYPMGRRNMDDSTNSRVEPRNVSMYPIHWAVVDAYAKDMGYPSTSAALRRIVDEWREIKEKQWRTLAGKPLSEVVVS